MRFRIYFLLIFICSTSHLWSQTNVKIHTEDIDHFWQAYDSVQTTTDTSRQLAFIQTIYLDQASAGLKDFMVAREHSAKRHLNNILRFPKYWKSIRPNTLAIQSSVKEIETIIAKFKTLYPNFKQPAIYFTIGCLNSGGTTSTDRILIGAEIATANAATDASELNPWLQNAFKAMNGVVFLVTHEMVHTQQRLNNSNGTLLSSCIAEGAADFISELLLQKEPPTPYLIYGKAHEKELWTKFQQEMNGTDRDYWLYNGNNAPNGVADLGYFMGYTICKSYYEHASNQENAIRAILELKLSNNKVVESFLKASGYANKWP